jgi:UDP-GlcNAc:undecaprenyl-phosphate GlcNAc-1-phosphate transferase
VREYALVFLVAASVTYLLTPLSRRFAVRIGAMAEPRDRDVHAIPTPRMGGVAMYGGVLAALLVAAHLPVLRTVAQTYDEPRSIAIAGGLIVLLGAVDDRWSLDPLTKLAGQIVAAGVMVLLGVRLASIVLPFMHSDVVLTNDVGVPLTVLLAVVLVNAINFIDGLDGLAAGVVGIAAAASFTFSYSLSADHQLLRAQPATLIAAILAGVCVGFLPHNFTPARVFMGDSGSMLIGLMLAASTTSITGEVDYGSAGRAGLSESLPLLVPVLVPVLVLAVPFVDLLLAVVRRTRAGRSPFSPDKAHIHHRLLELGHSQRRAVLLMYGWAALLGFGGVLISVSHGPALPASVLAGIVMLALLTAALPRLRSRAPHP